MFWRQKCENLATRKYSILRYVNLHKQNFIFVASLCSWGDWLEFRFVGNPEDRVCYGQIQQIGHIRKFQTCDATKMLVNSLVTSRMDYCNGLLYGVPMTTLKKLQTVQNTAARLISKTARHDHISPALKDLHWLPVQ